MLHAFSYMIAGFAIIVVFFIAVLAMLMYYLVQASRAYYMRQATKSHDWATMALVDRETTAEAVGSENVLFDASVIASETARNAEQSHAAPEEHLYHGSSHREPPNLDAHHAVGHSAHNFPPTAPPSIPDVAAPPMPPPDITSHHHGG